MALSRMAFGAAALLLADSVSAAYLQFPVYDSNDRPTEFRDGAMTYVRATRDYGQGTTPELEQFLLCTSCTISYIFGTLDDFETVKYTEEMSFKHGAGKIPVQFVTVNLQLYENNDEETPHSFTMDIGYIDPSYQSSTYFTNFKENMLGLAPMATDDEDLLRRQFLYQFVNADDQKDLGLEESFAFNGGESFTIGGHKADYEELVCEGGGRDEGFGFTNGGIEKERAIPEAKNDMNFAPVLYYRGTDLMLKVNNYLPPMESEQEDTVLGVDTYRRETLLPKYFYDYFMDTFMLPAYTCDKMRPQDLNYPGLRNTYACWCNNGDYHAMPTINFSIRNKMFQYDLGPSDYEYLPYLNYTQPMSLCVLGLDSSPPLPGAREYISLGQRAMSKFPFFVVFDRSTGSAFFELGNATPLIHDYDSQGVAAGTAIFVCLLLAITLIYTIALRYQRLQALDWLKDNHKVLFNHAAKLKSEDYILKQLLENKDLRLVLADRTQPTTPRMQVAAGMSQEARESLVGHEDGTDARRTNSMSGTNRKPQTSKHFSNEDE